MKSKKAKIIAIILVLLLILIGVAVFLLTRKQTAVQGASSQVISANLVILKPGIKVTRDSKELDTKDQKEVEILPGDQIDTDATGVAYLIFADNSSVTLDNSTEIIVKTEQENSDNFETKLFQSVGRTWMRVEKLTGKSADFQVETPTTIAAVRGTQFGCSVVDGKSMYYSIEHSITLTLKNQDNKVMTLEEGKEYTNADNDKDRSTSDLKSFTDALKDKWTTWDTLNVCLSDTARKLLGDNNVVNNLKGQQFVDQCVPGTSTPNPAPTPQPAPQPAPQPVSHTPVVTSINDNGQFTQGSISCNWAGQDVTGYKVAIGTSKYSGNNLMNWTNTNNTSVSASSNSYGQTYYCNVIALYNSQESGIYSTDGITIENAAATITRLIPDKTQFNGSGISVAGTYANAPVGDLQLLYQIKRTTIANGTVTYDQNGSWVSSAYWNSGTPSGSGGNFNYGSGGISPTILTPAASFVAGPTYNYLITVILNDKLDGRQLTSASSSAFY